jgi:pyruvate, orthophosphate dikinase
MINDPGFEGPLALSWPHGSPRCFVSTVLPNVGNDGLDVIKFGSKGSWPFVSVQADEAAVHRPGGGPSLSPPIPEESAGNRDGRSGAPIHAAYAHVYDIDRAPALPPAELTQLLGGKAANLVVMATELGLPVPPAFAITTTVCKTFLRDGWPDDLDAQLEVHVHRLAEQTGRRFGDPGDPLLVSVRSGAPISMPGMMDTILNLGLNETTAQGLGALTGDPEFAADCLRRFRQMYREIVGADPPDDPWAQLRGAVQAVFESWNSDRARAYRSHEQIPDDLGTAVTVQAMVFGNRGCDSGTGVLFTRNPATGEHDLYGDVMFEAQGEDVVAGTHRPDSLSVLDERLPRAGAELRRYAATLERHYRDLCDIEFTIERGKVWMLQVRVGKRSPQAALRLAVEMAEDPSFPLTREEAVGRVAHLLVNPPRVFVREPGVTTLLTTGLPASPGVASGEIATTSEAAEIAATTGRTVILVRPETSPEDVRGMAKSAGILTCRGGLASHAAVVARGWGIPAVVGAAGVTVGEREVMIAGRRFVAGERITIDGSSGEVHAGDVAGSSLIAPEAAALLAWADELGIEIGPREGDSEVEAAAVEPASSATVAVTNDEVAKVLLIKGVAAADQLSLNLGADPDAIQAAVDQLGADGLVVAVSGGHRLSAEGKLQALAAFDADRELVGADRLVELLSSFHELDLRMKDTVTAWQLRAGGDEPVFNDHSDATYDNQVLERLAELHRDALVWMAPLSAALQRFDRYQLRLERSLSAARGGDQRYVASPRVDSYHSVWFELHEDLIRLVGRRRSDSEDGAAGG